MELTGQYKEARRYSRLERLDAAKLLARHIASTGAQRAPTSLQDRSHC